MSIEYTLSILKPDSLRRNIIGKVNHYIENAGLKIVAQKMLLLTKKQAEDFYDIHKDRPYYNILVEKMTSGPVIVQVLCGKNAIQRYRDIMGATDPKNAAPGTIRADLGCNIDENTVHGSDSTDTAREEIKFFFAQVDYAYF